MARPRHGRVPPRGRVTISSEVNILVIGLLLIAFVVAAPEGLLGLAAPIRERFRALDRRAEKTA